MRSFRLSFAFLFLWCWGNAFAIPSTVAQDNWPEFRGNSGTGRVAAGCIPTDFSQAKIHWKVPVKGRSWSSPVVWEDQVWVTTATVDGKQLSALCFDFKSGKKIFDVLLHQPESPGVCHSTNTYASSTPAIESGRLYAHFGSNGTSCLDTATGEILWQRTDLQCDHLRGAGSSPILSTDLVMFAMDGVDQQFVIALNKQNGETVWQTTRDIDYGTDKGDYKKAYATGTIFDITQRQLLVLPSAVASVAYDIADGQLVWSVYHDGMNAAARPLRTSTGSVLVTNGMGKLVAVDPTGKGDVTDTHFRYMRSKVIPTKSTPIIVGQQVFMVSDKGVASCIDAESGDEIWAQRLGGKFDSSPVTDGEKILALNTTGKIFVFQAADSFKLLSSTNFADEFHASPAAARGDLILRSLTHLYRIEGVGAKSE